MPAMALAVGAGPRAPPPPRPPPPRPCPKTGATNSRDVPKRARLIDRFTRICAPSESVRLAMQRLERSAMIRGRARGIQRNRDGVADFQGVPLNALLAELARRAPLERPSLHLSVLIRSLHLKEGMGISKQDLYDRTFQLYLLVGLIRRRKGVMGVRSFRGGEENPSRNQQEDPLMLHIMTPEYEI